jgi:hypothetical protein
MPREKAHGPRGFAECRRCMNAEYDPFACNGCANGSAFEAYEEEQDAEDFSLSEFISTYREELS